MRHDGVQRAVFGQPLGRRFGANLFHARHVVHGVAHQRLVVEHLRGAHAEFGAHARLVAALAAHGVDDDHARRDQLRQILVAAGNQHLPPLRGRRGRQRANHVIGLNPRHAQHGPAQQARHLVNRLNLAAQVIGHGAAVGLVIGKQRIAKRGAGRIKHASRVRGLRPVLAQAVEHVHHAANGPRRLALRIGRIGPQIRHGMKGAIQVAGAVNQQQRGRNGFGSGCIGSGRRGSVWRHAAIVPGRFYSRASPNRH